MEQLFRDYIAWRQEHNELLVELMEHETTLYDRLYPVITVLDSLSKDFQTGMLDTNEELDKIISVGSEFLNEQVVTIQLYLDKVFLGDMHHFMDYEAVLNYLLYVEDIRYELVEKGYEASPVELEELLEELSTIIEEKKEIPDTLGIYVDQRVKEIASDLYSEFYSIIDIFMDVADTLGIDLYVSEDVIIGTDI
jgi:hypothetical protein